MSTDPIRSYLDARSVFDQATRNAERIVGVIASAGTILQNRNWKRAMVSNVQVGFPAEVALTTHNSINGNEWPTAQQLAEALAAWHQARHAVGNAWAVVPAPDRSGLQPPEEYR